jgi:hypothetical protein
MIKSTNSRRVNQPSPEENIFKVLARAEYLLESDGTYVLCEISNWVFEMIKRYLFLWVNIRRLLKFNLILNQDAQACSIVIGESSAQNS